MNTYGEALSEKARYFLQVSGTYQYGNYAIWVIERATRFMAVFPLVSLH